MPAGLGGHVARTDELLPGEAFSWQIPWWPRGAPQPVAGEQGGFQREAVYPANHRYDLSGVTARHNEGEKSSSHTYTQNL